MVRKAITQLVPLLDFRMLLLLLVCDAVCSYFYTGAASRYGSRHQHPHQHHHQHQHRIIRAVCQRRSPDHRTNRPRRSSGVAGQRDPSAPELDDEDIDGNEAVVHRTEEDSRAVMEQFKRRVMDDNGRVKAMSDLEALEAATAAAESILQQAEQEVQRRVSASAALFTRGEALHSRGGYNDHDPHRCLEGVALLESSQGNDREGEEEEFEEDEDEALLEWGDGSERKTERDFNGGIAAMYPRVMETVEDAAEYESIFEALQGYQAQHGNLLLTHKYLLPSEELGGKLVEHRGWRLGQKTYNMKFWQKHVRDKPQRRAALAKLGFVWGRLQDEYNIFVEALLVYKDIEGSLLVPSSFVVPEGDPCWPLCCQGMRLGAKVAGVRNQSLYVRVDVARWYQLDAMGFVWDLSDAPFREVYDALMEYKVQHGNMNVPVAFCVPSSNPWHKDLWGLALGQRVLDIRAHHRYIRNDPDRIRMLNDAGFRWTDAAKSSYVNVVRALKAYRKIKGRDFSVPSSFVVPSFLPWPHSCWGLRLGTALVDVRSKGRYLKGEDSEPRRLQLERLGVFAQSRETILSNVVTGLRHYLGEFGDAMVPQGFTVPDDEPWPPECRGQKLGSMLYGIRRRPERLDRHPGVRAELTALGFSWEVPKKGPRGPRKKHKELAPDAAACNDCSVRARANGHGSDSRSGVPLGSGSIALHNVSCSGSDESGARERIDRNDNGEAVLGDSARSNVDRDGGVSGDEELPTNGLPSQPLRAFPSPPISRLLRAEVTAATTATFVEENVAESSGHPRNHPLLGSEKVLPEEEEATHGEEGASSVTTAAASSGVRSRRRAEVSARVLRYT